MNYRWLLQALQNFFNTDAENDLQVDVKTLPSLPAGTNNIGDVDVVSLPSIPAGGNDIGSVHLTDGTDELDVLNPGDSPTRGILLMGSDYGSPAAARPIKVDSSGRVEFV